MWLLLMRPRGNRQGDCQPSHETNDEVSPFSLFFHVEPRCFRDSTVKSGFGMKTLRTWQKTCGDRSQCRPVRKIFAMAYLFGEHGRHDNQRGFLGNSLSRCASRRSSRRKPDRAFVYSGPRVQLHDILACVFDGRLQSDPTQRQKIPIFLCHHKQGGGGFTRLLKWRLKRDDRVRRGVFLDADNVVDLDLCTSQILATLVRWRNDYGSFARCGHYSGGASVLHMAHG